jgi:ribosomal-protein-alanine N-acetyltransferase
MLKEEILKGVQFSLIPFKAKHISDRYVGWLNDPEVNRFLEVRFVHQTNETVLAFVRSFYGGVEKYMWGIYPNDEDMVGTATLYSVNRDHGTAEIGLLIGETRYWGKGASAEAIQLMANFAFETLGLRRLTGGGYAANQGMTFTFKRLGFRLEGTQRRAYMSDSGTYVDGYRWGILADEWRARNG